MLEHIVSAQQILGVYLFPKNGNEREKIGGRGRDWREELLSEGCFRTSGKVGQQC